MVKRKNKQRRQGPRQRLASFFAGLVIGGGFGALALIYLVATSEPEPWTMAVVLLSPALLLAFAAGLFGDQVIDAFKRVVGRGFKSWW